MNRSRSWHSPARLCAAILAGYVVLAAGYCQATPILEAGDEFRHFFVVRHLAEGRGLPVLGADRGDPFSPEQEAGQPPLYHLLAALASGWVDARDARDLWLNPHVDIGLPSPTTENKNVLVHTEAEARSGVALAVTLARVVSVLLGGLTVALAYALGRAAAPAEPQAALLAAALVAANPMFLFVSASVANDSLIAATAALALLLLLRVLQRGATPARLLALSGALGLVALAKLSGLALLGLTGLALIYQAGRERSWWALPGRLALVAAGPLLLAGWWYLRNGQLYGDPTGIGVWLDVAGRRAAPPSLLELAGELPGLFISYWGVFGVFTIVADTWVYLLYGLLCLAGLVGLALRLRSARWRAEPEWLPIALFALWLGALLVALARWTQLTQASSGRLLFPGIASTAVLLAVGLTHLAGRRGRGPLTIGVVGLLAALAVFLPVRYIAPAYARPAPLAAAELGQPTHPTSAIYGGALELLGYDLDRDRARPGDEVAVTLFWRVLAPLDANYSFSVQLLGPDGRIGQRDLFPGAGKLATRLLRPGDHLREVHRFRIAPEAPAPIVGRLLVAVYDSANGMGLEARNERGERYAEVVIGELLVEPAAVRPRPDVGTPVDAAFGSEVRLLGYRLASAALAVGETTELRLYWQAERRMTVPYTVFVHLTEESGRPVAQYDGQPRGQRHPTDRWAPGEVVEDPVPLAIGPEVRPGRYRLLVGLYDLRTGQRLRLSTGRDAVELGWVEVVAAARAAGEREGR